VRQVAPYPAPMISSACWAALYTGNADARSTPASRIISAFGRSGRQPRVLARLVRCTPPRGRELLPNRRQHRCSSPGTRPGLRASRGLRVLGALISVFAIFIYMCAYVGTIRLYTTKRRYEPKPVKHIIHARYRHRDAIAPMYYELVPCPITPRAGGNIAVVVPVGVALLSAVITRSSRKTERAAADPEPECKFSARLLNRDDI